jgi:hypothetical protein
MSVVSLIVGLEIVWDDVALDDVRAELEDERYAAGAASPPLLAEDGHRAAIVDTARDHIGDDLTHNGCAVRARSLIVNATMRPMFRPASTQR